MRHASTLNARALAAMAAVALAGVAFQAPEAAFAQDGNTIQGAWVGQSSECSDIFVFKAGKPAFKAPVNMFAPAMIITGKRVVTPQASCRLKSTTPDGDRVTMILNCANTVAYGDVKVSLARRSDGKLVRFYDENDKSGSVYVLCPAR